MLDRAAPEGPVPLPAAAEHPGEPSTAARPPSLWFEFSANPAKPRAAVGLLHTIPSGAREGDAFPFN